GLGSGVPRPGGTAMQQRKSQLTKALESAAAALAKEWDGRLNAVLNELMDHGGRRVAVAEAAVARFIHFCDEAIATHHQKLSKEARSTQGQEQLDQALESCITGAGGWSLFGGRSKRLLRVFVDHLAAFSRQCLTEDLGASGLQFFAALRGRLGDRLRDLGFCRQRLRHVQEMLSRPADEDEGEAEAMTDTMTFTRNNGGGSSSGAQWPTPASAQIGQTPMLCTESYWESIRES